MLAKAKTEIVQEKIDLLLKVGLGQFGKVSIRYVFYENQIYSYYFLCEF